MSNNYPNQTSAGPLSGVTPPRRSAHNVGAAPALGPDISCGSNKSVIADSDSGGARSQAAPRSISDDTLVRLLDLTPETGSNSDIDRGVEPVEEWRGTLAEYERDNELSIEDSIYLRSELLVSGFSIQGGGAMPAMRLEVVHA